MASTLLLVSLSALLAQWSIWKYRYEVNFNPSAASLSKRYSEGLSLRQAFDEWGVGGGAREQLAKLGADVDKIDVHRVAQLANGDICFESRWESGEWHRITVNSSGFLRKYNPGHRCPSVSSEEKLVCEDEVKHVCQQMLVTLGISRDLNSVNVIKRNEETWSLWFRPEFEYAKSRSPEITFTVCTKCGEITSFSYCRKEAPAKGKPAITKDEAVELAAGFLKKLGIAGANLECAPEDLLVFSPEDVRVKEPSFKGSIYCWSVAAIWKDETGFPQYLIVVVDAQDGSIRDPLTPPWLARSGLYVLKKLRPIIRRF